MKHLPETFNEDNFNCGICHEIIVDPTTLTCGHTMCRYCVAQWWYNSKKCTCPECRQVWHGFPQVNFTLRNTIKMLFPAEVAEREGSLAQNNEYKEMMDLFNSNAKGSEGNNPSPPRSFNWTFACLFVAVSIAVAVVFSVGMKQLNGRSQIDIMSKSLHDWSPEDVSLWVSELGPWSKDFGAKFVQAGIDGSLLQKIDENDLKDPPINIKMALHRRAFFQKLSDLNNTLLSLRSGLWEYKERRSGMAIFIMLGIREFPRATLAYLFFFNYQDTFLPIFYGTNNLLDQPSDRLMFKKINYKEWMQFLPRFLLVPYYLVARFASHYLDINYWTSRVVIMHAVLMTLLELTNARLFFRTNLRLPHYILKYSIYVSLLSMTIKILWRFVPFFIADCIFYWLLYVSPFDALNRLRKRLTGRHQQENVVVNQ